MERKVCDQSSDHVRWRAVERCCPNNSATNNTVVMDNERYGGLEPRLFNG